MAGETDQTQGQTSQTSGQVTSVPTNVPTTKPWNTYVVLVALVLVSVGVVWVLVAYQDIFKTPTDVTTVLTSWFTVVGTLCGAFFGIKAASDVSAQAQSTIQTASGQAQYTIQSANSVSQQAMGKLTPEQSSGIQSPPLQGPQPQ
jgi:hypothetical protein